MAATPLRSTHASTNQPYPPECRPLHAQMLQRGVKARRQHLLQGPLLTGRTLGVPQSIAGEHQRAQQGQLRHKRRRLSTQVQVGKLQAAAQQQAPTEW